jgi:hypothetical protein
MERAYLSLSVLPERLLSQRSKDQEPDVGGVGGVSLSPGVRRMRCRVGGKESFEQGREDLQELAGVVV